VAEKILSDEELQIMRFEALVLLEEVTELVREIGPRVEAVRGLLGDDEGEASGAGTTT
jgi:hypothetical protein